MRPLLIVTIAMVVLGGIGIFLSHKRQSSVESVNQAIPTSNMKIESSAFQNNGKIPVKYTCDGEDINPPLAISGVPSNTKSMALIVDDPDAPSGDFVHWVVFNIPPDITEIKEGTLPMGAVEGTNGSGRADWTSPCPPSGTHRYFFKLYALDTILSLGQSTHKANLIKAMQDHVLGEVSLLGLYDRSNNK